MPKKIVRVNALSFAKLIGLLMEGYTCHELVRETGLAFTTIYHYTRAMHKEGVVHISGWEEDAAGRITRKVYKLGPGKDAKPKLKSKAEINRAQQQRRAQLKMIQATAGLQ